MKKIIIVLTALLIGLQAQAQLIGKVGYLNAGEKASIANMRDQVSLNGFTVGADYRIPFKSIYGFGLTPGAHVNFLFGSDEAFRYSDIALSIPVMATYALDLNNVVRIIGNAGPTLQLGLAKNATTNIGAGKTDIYDYYAKSSTTTFSRAMLLLGVGAGVELFDKFQISLGVDIGLTSYFREGNAYARRPYQFKLGVGYLF